MRGINSLRAVLVLAIAVTMVASSASAAVIYEPFNYDLGGIGGENGGTGFTGPWVNSKNNPNIDPGSKDWGTLSVDGNHVRGAAWSNMTRQFGSTLSDAGLMADGATLWFSVVMDLEGQNTSNADINVALASDQFVNSFSDRENLLTGEGIGVTHSRAVIEGVYWQDSGDGDTVAERNENASSTVINGSGGNLTRALIVGKIEWGAGATADETLTLYAPDTSLAMGSPTMAAWTIPALDQSQFDRLAVQFKDQSKIDEIRFGATYDEVTVPEPATLALVGLGGLAMLRRRRK